MQIVEIFQTVSYYDPSGNKSSDIIRSEEEDAWLGHGFYFWETYFQNAKWWGYTHCQNEYIVFKAAYDFDSKVYLDLVGNPNHRLFFEKSYEVFRKKDPKYYKVGEVIEMLKILGEFDYLAVRAYPLPQKRIKKSIPFEDSIRYVLERQPRFQICVCDRKFLHYNPRIVYENQPIEGYI